MSARSILSLLITLCYFTSIGYWTILYDNGITLQLRPFTVIAGSTELDTLSECREPGSACRTSILNFYSHYTKKALDIFSFTSQTRVTSNKHLVHRTSRFYMINVPTGSEHRPLSDKIVYIYNSTVCQFRSGTVQISILLGSGVTSPMNWCSAFGNSTIVSKMSVINCPMTRHLMPKAGDLNFT